MPQQDLYIGLGSMAYALAKMDGRLQPEELTTLRQVLHDEPYGEIAISMINLNDKYSVEAEKAFEFALRRFTENRRELDVDLKKKFIGILQRVAESYDGTSRKELELIRRCRKELNRL